MSSVSLQLNNEGRGAFYLNEGDNRLGEMNIEISGNTLVVYHTEVIPEAEGKGFAKDLLTAMVDYAKKENLKVIALCPYVNVQFRRHPDLYADIWNNN